jgi:ketosteroid isomerase-like protein
MSDEDKVLAVIKDMCNKDHTVGMKHMHDNCVFVRPTGNPLNKKEWDNMMNNNDVSVEMNDLVSVNKMQIVGDMAFVCYTTHGKFNYKGIENNDIAVVSSVLQRVDGKWMVVHGQRSTGRSPDDAPPQFD